MVCYFSVIIKKNIMRLEKDLQNIAQIAKQKEKENVAFRNYLVKQDIDKVGEIVQRLNRKIAPLIDCCECGNCCMNLRPIATDEEMSKFLNPEDIESCRYAMGFKCKYLENKKCTNYQNRPEECRAYPPLDKEEFKDNIYSSFFNYGICPIVFNVVECLKVELKWTGK
ncbi:YkgJ family cysteine cluster protein [Puteibacter caeruleilacunae]|nr:YkgJ family cysteine cluster protein [Puteibacter caeruleilacunae]